MPFGTIATKNYLDSMAKFDASSKLSQAIMTYIVSNVSYREVTNDILNVFKELDTNGDGKITHDELVEGFSNAYKYKDKE